MHFKMELQDSSEIILICWFAVQEPFTLIIISVKNSYVASYTFKINFIFLFEIEIFCNIINGFTITFDQFNDH